MRLATVSGYHEGFERGTSDGKARQSFRKRDDGIYQEAMTGYARSAWLTKTDPARVCLCSSSF